MLIANLFLLLVGFALLARHFEESRIPVKMSSVLPDGWLGGFVLLLLVFVISSFLDNIAAAVIGAAVARQVFNGRVRIGFIAAIVAASNAGGAGSVIGDTTTTMLWIGGVHPLSVLHAYVACVAAFFAFAIPAALAQQKHAPIVKDPPPGVDISYRYLAAVIVIISAAIFANMSAHFLNPNLLDQIPLIGLAVSGALLMMAPFAKTDWSIVPGAARGAVFLIALVSAASLMPVQALPPASWHATLGLGFISAVFDNIPLTALALKQGGYDWGFLAYAVGFGGSMIWFGSSAGVAVCGLIPEAKSTGRWLKEGAPVAVAYVVGFSTMLAVMGWNPSR